MIQPDKQTVTSPTKKLEVCPKTIKMPGSEKYSDTRITKIMGQNPSIYSKWIRQSVQERFLLCFYLFLLLTRATCSLRHLSVRLDLYSGLELIKVRKNNVESRFSDRCHLGRMTKYNKKIDWKIPRKQNQESRAPLQKAA